MYCCYLSQNVFNVTLMTPVRCQPPAAIKNDRNQGLRHSGDMDFDAGTCIRFQQVKKSKQTSEGRALL